MEIKVIYEDDNLLVVDKPAGMPVFHEVPAGLPAKALASAEALAKAGRTIADCLLEIKPELKKMDPPRFGIVHRLDKDTSGILLVAKSPEALIFFQKQFKNKTIQKRYLALVVGGIKDEKGNIETLIGRSPKDKRKQKAFFVGEPGSFGKRQAATEYKIIEKFQDYTLLEVMPKTGRKHQIRCHLAYAQHPIAGDKLYGFKRQPTPKGLSRQFLHASYLKIQLASGQPASAKGFGEAREKEFSSDLPEELNNIITCLRRQESLKKYDY